MLADIKTVVSAVAPISHNNPIILVTDPVSAVTLRQWRDRVPYQVFGSSALSAGVLIGVATNCIASSVDEVPKYETSREATLHMNTVPTAISTVGTPNVIAAPVRSLFQTDSIGVKISLGASWLLRSTS